MKQAYLFAFEELQACRCAALGQSGPHLVPGFLSGVLDGGRTRNLIGKVTFAKNLFFGHLLSRTRACVICVGWNVPPSVNTGSEKSGFAARVALQ